MELDAASFAKDVTLECDLCIVGAGPAGLALARAFAGTSTRVLLAESGGTTEEPHVQALNRGEVTGEAYNALETMRYRGVGGTARIWNTPFRTQRGARYVPLDPIDFEQRPWFPGSGWPLDRPSLEPFYVRANELCGLGRFDYGDVRGDGRGIDPPRRLLDSDVLRPRCYRLGTGRVFTEELVDHVRGASNVTLLFHASVVGLRSDGAASRIDALRALTPRGYSVFIRATVFAIAAGGIENARLLLPSRDRPAGIGCGSVGRGFVEHPRDHSLGAIPDQAEAYALAAFCETCEASSGAIVQGRLALDEAFLRRERILNASITLLPVIATPMHRARQRLRQWLTGSARSSSVDAIPRELLRTYPRAPDGWARASIAPGRFAGIRVLINLEQAPHPDNAVCLGKGVDRHGERVAAVRWRWSDDDARNLARLHDALKRELPRLGLGRIEVVGPLAPDPNAHHPAGTTRMSGSAANGAVDENCRVHTTENLYVIGSSVFPTAGFANPTLTIVALALRLGEHLRRRLGVAEAARN